MPDFNESRQQVLLLLDNVLRELDQPALIEEQRWNPVLAVGVEVDGASFNLVHHADVHRHELLLDCQLGAPPDDTDALHELLEGNLSMLRSKQGSYGWWRDLNVVTYGSLMDVGSLEAHRLIEVMRELAVQSQAWRSGAFFETHAHAGAHP